jgi:hypothetical protein
VLRFGQEEERPNRFVQVPVEITCVLHNADDLVLTLRSDAVLSEVLANRILALEEPLPKAWLMTATLREVVVSRAVMPRPRRIGVPTRSK